MVIDSSAIIAIILKEFEADAMLSAIEKSKPNQIFIAAPTYFESFTVMYGRNGEKGAKELAETAKIIGWKIESFDHHLFIFACEAYRRFNRGKNGLNMGDCFAYALAKARNEPLLCKGNDFKATDISVVEY